MLTTHADLWILIVALVAAFYVAWSIGANDVANAMGTSVGSGALTLRKALVIAGIMEFCGAFFVGGSVSETIKEGVVDVSLFASEPQVLVYGMLAVLLAVGLWVQIASYYGWPVSTTHTIVGALVGFGLVYAGIDAIHWHSVTTIGISWVISPVLGAVLSYLIFSFIRWRIFYSLNPVGETKKVLPFFVTLIISIILFVVLYKGVGDFRPDLSLWPALGLCLLGGLLAGSIAFFLVARLELEHTPKELKQFRNLATLTSLHKAIRHLSKIRLTGTEDVQLLVDKKIHEIELMIYELEKGTKIAQEGKHFEYRKVEGLFIFLQILTASFMAFSHGANDVANAIGPIGTIIDYLKTGKILTTSSTPSWVLALGGVGIVVGLATWGWRVIATVGEKITDLTPSRGFAAELGAAVTIIFASRLGLPISTTHTLIGSIIGIGMARGIGALNLAVLRDIAVSWVITLPAGAVLTVLFFYLIQWVFIA